MSYAYPFDPNGNSPTNLVSNEIIVLTGKGEKSYNYIIPKFAPFFGTGFVLNFKDTNNNSVVLTEGVDYHKTHKFLEATKACAKSVYGSITFVDEDLKGICSISYQTIGDRWTIDEQAILNILATSLNNPRSTSWGSITTLPSSFPVIDHEWELTDMVGANELTIAILRIAQAVLDAEGGGGAGGGGIIPEVLKADMDLENVPNYVMASDTESEQATLKTRFISPYGVRLAIVKLVGEAFNAHTANKANPHNVTAEQLGALTVAAFNVAITDLINRFFNAGDLAKNSSLLQGKTINDIVAVAQAGTAANSEKLGGSTKAEVISAVTTLIETRFASLETQTSELDQFDTLLSDAMDALVLRVTSNETSIAELLTETNKINGIQVRLAAVESVNEGQTTDIDTLKTKVSALESASSNSQLVADLSELTTKVNTNTADITTIKTSLTNHLAEINSLKAKVATLETQVASADIANAALASRVTELETRLAELIDLIGNSFT